MRHDQYKDEQLDDLELFAELMLLSEVGRKLEEAAQILPFYHDHHQLKYYQWYLPSLEANVAANDHEHHRE